MRLNESRFVRTIRESFALLAGTPVHPQWLIKRSDYYRFVEAAEACRGSVLDIGCSDQQLKRHLPPNTEYIGLDYWDTAIYRYKTRPSVFGDAQHLPFRNKSIDTVVMLEVLEHIPDPEKVFKEIGRVLKPKGRLIMSMPFLYPLHDSPFDFQRFTHHGLENIAKRHNFHTIKRSAIGTPLATSALLMNLGFCYSTLRCLESKNPLLVLSLLIPPLILVFNGIGWMSEKFGTSDDFMALGFSLILERH